ncbi:GNAT family N-acetyltransferase [Cytobacillus purgationiresistens]|uniref:Ribosomal protein S18 acetylase RimI-like enzyme n=1 Tax=Cytobacillus purgationiresistens TaxID=863449 RepID=A0ABU0ABT1_9BACI|nr:GNAT family N-acetyltransferase [Cytobacillus purgationiresistens]MDQ0268176.1 ribosomal protein S18 acetylase RimI-like enzyme [Cytobacillus purgationiresistens]
MPQLISESIKISKLQESEKEVVRQILDESYSQYKCKFHQKRWQKYIEDIYHSIDHPTVDTILVAKRGDVLLGTVQLYSSSDSAYGMPELEINEAIIRFLAVVPSARSQGIAFKLLKAVQSIVENQKGSHMFLHTSDVMTDAIQLYHRFGFVRDRTKEYYKENDLIKCFRYDLKNECKELEK